MRGNYHIFHRMPLKTKLWMAMGLMIAMMVLVGSSNMLSTRMISDQARGIKSVSYPLALNSMHLQLWVERALSTIYLAASAGREDLLDPLPSIDQQFEECLGNIKNLVIAAPALLEKMKDINRLYKKTRDIGLKWVQATLDENWDIEPKLAKEFIDDRDRLQRAITEIKVNGVSRFSISITQISDHTETVWVQTSAVFFVGFIFFSMLTIKLYRSITTPIQGLVSVIEDIRHDETEFRKRVSVHSMDEIGQLGAAFNQMLDDLENSQRKIKDYTEKLERKVEERTAQLHQEQQALRESERHLKTIWDSTPSGIIVIDAGSHRITDANPYALKLLSRSLEEVVGQVCHKFICPAEVGKCPITDMGQEVDGAERILVNVQNEKIPILKTVVPFTKKGHQYLIESFIDITDLKKAEEKLKLARQEAEKANRAKSDFLTHMSHELRTPLNHIIGFTELIVDKNFGDLTPPQEEYLNDVLFSGKHLLSLINDILDLSKIEAGKLELKISNVHLRDLLQGSLVIIKEKAAKHDIRLIIDIDGIPEIIRADERKLKQIIYNLLSNALKFTPDGGAICMEAKRVGGNGVLQSGLFLQPSQLLSEDLVEISVKDTGIGLKKEDIDLIFNPFEQADTTSTRNDEGTGLGLALTKNLVELHGGKIWAKSQGEGKGSTFHFILPVKST